MENIEKKIKKLKKESEKRQFIINFLSDYDYKDQLIIINRLIKIEQNNYKRLKRVKKYYLNKNKNKNVIINNNKLKEIEQFLTLLLNIKKEIKKSNKENRALILELDYEQILYIDDIFNSDSLSLIKKINDTKSSKSRLDYIIDLKNMYEERKANINDKKVLNFINNVINYVNIIIDNKNYLKSPCLISIINEEKINNSTNTIYDKNNEYYYPMLNVSDEQIEVIDSINNTNTLVIFNKLNNETNIKKRLELLYTLKEIYLEIYKNYNKKREHNKKKNDNKNYELDINYVMVKKINCFINSAIRIEHKREKNDNKKIINEKIEEEKLSIEHEDILYKMKNNISLEDYELKDVLIVYKYFIINNIREYPKIVLEISKYITNKIIEDDIKEDEIIIMIGSIRDTIKYRLLSLDKNDISNDLERSLLKEIRIVFDFISKNYKEDLNSTNHDYKYDIIKYFLMEEEGYPYIKRIINDMPQVVNVKVKENCNEHIIITILKEYIFNLSMLLKDKNSDYINPDYLKQVYILFSHSPYLRLTDGDIDTIDTIIDNFLDYIEKNIYKEERKTEAKKELKKLRPEYFYYEKKIKLKKIKEHQLMWQIDFLRSNRDTLMNKSNIIDIKEETITINNVSAYSFVQEGNKKILKIHVIDAGGIVAPRTTVDSKIYNYMICNEVINYDIKKDLILEVGKYNPVITYELTIEKGNNVSDFKIYKSRIKLDKKIFDDDLLYEKSETLNNLLLLAKKSLLIRGREVNGIGLYTIDSIMEMILNEEVIKYIENNNIPFIYSGIEYINDYITHMNNLSSIFNRLADDEFKKLYKIINENAGEFCYSIKPFNVDGEYNLHLMNNIDYLLIYTQRLITDIIINKECIKDKTKYKRECEDLVHNLNLSIGYIKPDDMKFENKRKRNKLKEHNL